MNQVKLLIRRSIAVSPTNTGLLFDAGQPSPYNEKHRIQN